MVLKTGALAQQGGFANPTNLLVNGDFESWSGGTSVAPDSWTLEGAGMAVAREASTIKIGTYSAKLTAPAGGGWIGQQLQTVTNKPIAYWQGRTVTMGCWVWCASANRAALYVTDGVTGFLSSYHPGDSAWHWMTLTCTVSGAATYVKMSCLTDSGSGSAVGYFDGAIVVEGSTAPAFSDNMPSYLTGTWSPVLAFGGTPAHECATDGHWTKIGRLIFITARLQLVTHGAATGDATLSLPFATPNDAIYRTTVFVAGYKVTFGGMMYGFIAEDSSVISLLETSEAGTVTALTDADFTDYDAHLRVSGFYRIS